MEITPVNLRRLPRRAGRAGLLVLLLAFPYPSTGAPMEGPEMEGRPRFGAMGGAQRQRVPVSGTVTDETGGVMQAVTVRLFPGDATDPIEDTTTDRNGHFAFEVPPGGYRVEVSAQAFQTVNLTIGVAPGIEPVTVVLPLGVVAEEVAVDLAPEDELRLDPLASLTATLLSQDELLALPTDEEDLVEYLMLLAGADSSGNFEEDIAGFIIDGFDQGRLPDPEEIAQIIIDPVSLRADGSGDGPRIEIITRPGSGRWRRSADFNFADESLDATTPGERTKPARQTRDLDVDLRGPLIPGVVDIDLEASTSSRERAANSLFAITPTGNVFDAAVRPETEHELELDADIALSTNRTLGLDFDYETQQTQNDGVGGFTLPERGTNEDDYDWAFQVSERRLGTALVNDLRFRVERESSRDVPVTHGVAIDVADAFNSGGGTRSSLDEQTRFQIEDRLRWQRLGWSFEAGLEGWYDNSHNVSESNYNGHFDFASLHDYCRASDFVGVNCQPSRQIVESALAGGVTPTYLDARGDPVEITGIPATYRVTSGNATLDIDEVGVESFFQADRGFGEDASLRLGVRYEATNHSLSFWRLSPTANVQYRLFPDTIISAGGRVSARDFRSYATLIRNDGMSHQKQLSISSPSFPDPFLDGTVQIDENRTSLSVLDPAYRSPVSFDPQVSVTQQLPGSMRLTVSYSMNFGYRQQRTRNINAPFPGTPLSDEILDLPRDERLEVVDRMRPFYPSVGNINQFESTGHSIGRRLRVRFQRRRYIELAGVGFSGSANYSYRWGEDDNDYNNPYDPLWGLARLEHTIESQIRVRMPRDIDVTRPWLRALARATYQDTNLSFSLRANAGRPYSIRSGRDLNGDQSTRDRPPGVPRNSATGPGRVSVDMTFTKYLRAAEQPRAADGRSRDGRLLRLQVRVSNLLNTSQVRGYSGVLSSPLFGLPTGYNRGRTVRLSTHVDF